ncbi:MAG TPA: hypothetical protein DCF33_16185 [Saprospirales bacterium]|nr:hypothetical protein [Saprospirales bacterium]
MKKWIYSWMFLATVVFSGWTCQKTEDQAPGFDMLFEREFSIPAGIGVFDVHHFQLKNISSDWDRYLQELGKTGDQITRVVNGQASIGGTFGDADLSIIDRISVRVYDEANPNDWVEIAYRDPAPLNTGNVLPLIPSLADVKRFFEKPRFSVDVVIWLRGTTLDQSDVRLSLTMRSVF